MTTRDFCQERTAGPYSPDSHNLPRLLEGAAATNGAQRGAKDGADNIASDSLNDYTEKSGFGINATTLDATQRVMTTCATDADVDDYQSGTAYATAYEPASDCGNVSADVARLTQASITTIRLMMLDLNGSSRPQNDTP